jgi:drug/metabolite transporter (DMT)-like permease
MNDKNQSLLLGVITILCWGSIATFGTLLNHMPPFYVLGASFLIGGLPALAQPRHLFPSWKISLWGIGGYFGYHFFLFYSFRFAPAIEANLINYLWPVIMVLLTPVFFKEEKLKWFNILGGILSVLGCVFLVAGKAEGLQIENIKGHLLALLAALTWPIYSIGKKKMGEVSVWAVGGFCLGSSILCFLTHFLIEPRVVLQFEDAWKLFVMGIGPFGVSFYFWDIATKKGDTRVLGALAYLTPVISTLGLLIFGNQNLSPSVGMAMVLIIAGASTGLLDFLPLRR